MNDNETSYSIPNEAEPLTKYDALAILYLQKQDMNGASPEEVVGRYIEAHDRIKKEFVRQKDARRRRLNPLPL